MSTDNSEVPILTAEQAQNAYEDATYLRGAYTQMGLQAIADGRAIAVRTAELKRIVAEMREERMLAWSQRILKWADELEQAMGDDV